MPSINRIRVNNVKYNFGTQYYDDFTMRMYGKNTLYDLANGGGKSVLMLLLMQNMIPNSTLDEKQPIEKLFRTGNGNTTIHSLIEWKLDEPDIREGYRYMTTGFCARKAETIEGNTVKRDVASVEYFNYCIFYREFNKNDIINLPLTKNGEHVGYQTLRTYLKELPHKDMNLKVLLFDRKGEYQRFISEYGIHESQWEIIRGINKTEGHVRTYFENNYKTTRKVVEDLLIEEIIEKAYNVKTEAEGGADSMAKTLMEIKEQLAELARKKKDISSYDHQAELVGMLSDRVNSFSELYREYGELSGVLADLCVTGEAGAKKEEGELARLTALRDEKQAQADEARYDLACLTVARDKQKLSVLKAEAERLSKEARDAELEAEKLTHEIEARESANDYLDYMEEQKKLSAQEAVIKNLLAGASFDEAQLAAFAANLKRYVDAELKEIEARKQALSEELKRAGDEQEYREKLREEAKLSLAACESARETARKSQDELMKQLSEVRMEMNNLSIVAADDEYETAKKHLDEVHEEEKTLREALADTELSVREARLSYDAGEAELVRLSAELEKHRSAAGDLASEEKRLSGLLSVYGEKDAAGLAKKLSEKITDAVLLIAADEKETEKLLKRRKHVEEGRMIEPPAAVLRVSEYLETRHGVHAIYGADYISALNPETRDEVLRKNPELPYGLVCDKAEGFSDDPDLTGMTGLDMPVLIFEKEHVDAHAAYMAEHVISICADRSFFTENTYAEQLTQSLNAKLSELKEQVKNRRELLDTYREDYAFVLPLSDGRLERAREEFENLKKEYDKKKDAQEHTKQSLRAAEHRLREETDALSEKQALIAQLSEDQTRLDLIRRLSALLAAQEEIEQVKTREIKRISDELAGLTSSFDEGSVDVQDLRQKLADCEAQEKNLLAEWKEYAVYYDPETEYEELSLTREELCAKFASMLLSGRDAAGAIEDKRALIKTIEGAMERILKNIKKRGTDVDALAKRYESGELFVSAGDVMSELAKSVTDARNNVKRAERQLYDKRSEADRLAGSISYQTAQVEKQYGSLKENTLSMAELAGSLEEGEALVKRLAKEAKEAAQAVNDFSRTQGFMLDLYKDAKRIVQAHGISLENAVPMQEEPEQLRRIFEEKLLAFDRVGKLLARAKNELLKAKGNTAQSLDQMGVFELANSIREDLVIPENYEEARALIENLSGMEEFIKLEKERVEKSLTDMKTIKESFEEQCLQRCLDVKTELDKLPKLSRIMMEGETIQMVGLTIPYVKEEFMRQRMSEYIDGIVAHVDTVSEEKDRLKYIRGALTLKKLFSVIVTDMNQIRLSLYKRERIKEQSRYLKYEEAVGSTGQSQGIYIQFLVSVINYISGMYGVSEDETRTKTVFIDNPFGAAKDIYIWEPIFALLAANHVQLIVPARGATPAITGRFDVNYILGQQMSGNKQLTVVTDFTSTVDQAELEYSELDYEQVSFDFI